MQQSLGPEQRTDLDGAIKMLEESLKLRAPGPGGPKVPLVPGMPGVAIDDTQPGGLPLDPNEPDIVANSPSWAARAMYRAFGTDVDDPMPLTRMGTTLAGGLGGGRVGSQIPGGPIVKGIGAAVGSVIGTVSGAMAPENTIDALEMLGVLEPGSRDRLGLSDEDLKTVLLGEAALDLWFMGGVAAVRAGARGVSNFMTGANATSKGLAEAATREGIALLPVQVGEGRFARGYVSVMGRLPLIGTPVKKGAERAMDQIGRMFEGVPERLGPLASMDEVSGRILRDAHHTAEGIARHFDDASAALLARADAMKVVVRPTHTRTVTDSLMRRTQSEIPKGFAGQSMEATAGTRDLRAFLSKNMRLLTDLNPQTGMSGNQIADLPLRQMDTMLKNVDAKIAQWAAKGDTQTVGRLNRLRSALTADSIAGMVPAGRDASGRQTLRSTPESNALMTQFRNLDEDLTYTVNQLFNSATANRLGLSTSITGRSIVVSDLGTKGMDKLGEVVLRGDNPAAIAELQRLTQPNTMRQLANSVFNKALEESYTATSQTGQRMFDPDQFASLLGISKPTSSKFRQTTALMDAAGGLTMGELQTFIQFSSRAGGAEIPNVSQFLARKITLGGFSAALIGGSTLAGGYTGGLISGIGLVGGLRLVSSVISNPQSARALRTVFNEEASAVVRKAAFGRAVAYGVYNMVRDGHADAEQGDNLIYNLNLYASTLQKQIERNAP